MSEKNHVDEARFLPQRTPLIIALIAESFCGWAIMAWPFGSVRDTTILVTQLVAFISTGVLLLAQVQRATRRSR